MSKPEPAKRRLLAGVVVAAALVLGGEAAWYSDPVQDWWISRQTPEQLAARSAADPGSTRLRYYYAVSLLRRGRSAEALEQARAGTLMDPASGRMFRVAGMAARKAGAYAEAGKLLTRARELGDRSPELLEELAGMELEQGRSERAHALLTEAVRRYPNRAEGWHLLGLCRSLLGIYEGWTDAMQRATRLAPREPKYWVGLAESWLFRDRPAEALQAADRAVALAPRDPDALLVRARALAASPAAAQASADTAFRAALEAAPAGSDQRTAVDRELGRFLARSGRAAEALPFLEQACTAAPEDQATAYALAHAYRRAKRDSEADRVLRRFEVFSGRLREVRYLRARLVIEPKNAALRRALIRALEQAGQTQAAQVERQRLSDLDHPATP